MYFKYKEIQKGNSVIKLSMLVEFVIFVYVSKLKIVKVTFSAFNIKIFVHIRTYIRI